MELHKNAKAKLKRLRRLCIRKTFDKPLGESLLIFNLFYFQALGANKFPPNNPLHEINSLPKTSINIINTTIERMEGHTTGNFEKLIPIFWTSPKYVHHIPYQGQQENHAHHEGTPASHAP